MSKESIKSFFDKKNIYIHLNPCAENPYEWLEQISSDKNNDLRFSDCLKIIKYLSFQLRYQDGLKPGDLWAIKGFDPLLSFLLIWAAHLNGALFIPLNPLYDDPYDHIYLSQAPFTKILRPSSWCFDYASQVEERDFEKDMLDRLIAPIASKREPFFGIFTSGSSGKPKAVIHSLKSLCYSARASCNFYELKEQQTWLLSLGLHHIGGFMILLRSLLKGSRVRLGGNLLADLQSYEPDYVSMVPTQLSDALKEEHALCALKKAKAVIVGGAACNQALREKALHAKVALSVSYGSTETGAQITASRPGSFCNEPSAGEIIGGRSVKISENGQIICQDSGVMLGYYQDGRFVSLPQDQGFVSSDHGAIVSGELHVNGRVDDTYMVGGEGVCRLEIQSAVDFCLESIKPLRLQAEERVSVVMLSDDRLGVVPALVWESLRRPDFLTLLEAIRKQLPSLKRPRSIFWLCAVPGGQKVSQVMLTSYLDRKDPRCECLWSYRKNDC